MATIFQRAYKLTLGQFNTSDTFNVITEITDLRFTATINVTAKNGTTVTPEVTTVNLFNLSPELIQSLTGTENLYIEIKAGYRLENNQFVDLNDLPIVYFGSIVYIQTMNRQTDLVTTLQCTPMHGKSTAAKANRIFTTGTPVREVFNYLANTMNASIVHEWEDADTLILKKDKTVVGSSTKIMQDWAERYNLRACNEKSSVIKIIDKAVRNTGKLLHQIPLSRTKGYPSVSVDVSKVLKEKTTNTPNVKLDTFLYSNISLNDTVRVELIDYTVPQVLGQYQTNTQDFIVNRYSHRLDSHEGGSNLWTTTIEGKGAQK